MSLMASTMNPPRRSWRSGWRCTSGSSTSSTLFLPGSQSLAKARNSMPS